MIMISSFIACNGKSDAAYFRALAARSSSNSSTTSESDPLLDALKDDLVPDAISPVNENAISPAPLPRQTYGTTINA
jgi:hypothetical protein